MAGYRSVYWGVGALARPQLSSVVTHKKPRRSGCSALRGTHFTQTVLLPLRLAHLLESNNRYLQHLLVGLARGQGLERQVGFDNEAYKG